MIPTCQDDGCGRWIEADNRQHPGYCSPRCRDRVVRRLAPAFRRTRRAALRGDPTAIAALQREDQE